MQVPSYFRDFLTSIRLTANQISDAKTGHETLRERIADDDDLSEILVTTLLQGSYRRATAIRPKEGQRADVDVIVVTNMDPDSTAPADAIERLIPFVDTHYPDKYRRAGRSIQIELSYVDLDLVVTAAPSETQKEFLKAIAQVDVYGADELTAMKTTNAVFQRFAAKQPQWEAEPLLIPDREADEWKRTHPLEQIRWTTDKNSRCNGHYVNVVKALKWWRLENHPDHKYPKGYPLEHIIGDCCPDGIDSVADGITLTLEEVSSRYASDVANGKVPFLPDRGVPEHNVLARTSLEEFAAFHGHAREAAGIAREALDEESLDRSVRLWRELFGSRFPNTPEEADDSLKGQPGAFTKRKEVSDPRGGRWA